MIRQTKVCVVCILLIGTLGVEASGPAPQPFTLLVVPERPNTIQVGFDLLDKRPVALVSYRAGRQADPWVLHAWTGDDWMRMTLDEYENGKFLVRQPDRIILVGDEQTLPIELVLASGWGPLVLNIDTLRTDEFLNDAGRLFEFTRSEWRWFADRYQLTVEDVTPASERISWYDQLSAERERPPPRRAPTAPAPAVTPVPLVPQAGIEEWDVPEEPDEPEAPIVDELDDDDWEMEAAPDVEHDSLEYVK